MQIYRRSLSSLAEVVLQNRRGLDLLFLQQGGFCTALVRNVCCYVDYSGVNKKSLALVRKRLQNKTKQNKIERTDSGLV